MTRNELIIREKAVLYAYKYNDFDKAIIELYVNTPLELRQEVKKKMKEFIQKVNWEE